MELTNISDYVSFSRKLKKRFVFQGTLWLLLHTQKSVQIWLLDVLIFYNSDFIKIQSTKVEINVY